LLSSYKFLKYSSSTKLVFAFVDNPYFED